MAKRRKAETAADASAAAAAPLKVRPALSRAARVRRAFSAQARPAGQTAALNEAELDAFAELVDEEGGFAADIGERFPALLRTHRERLEAEKGAEGGTAADR